MTRSHLGFMEISIYEARTYFFRLVARVAEGEEVVITREGKPVAKLVPLEGVKRPRPLGLDEGRYKVPDDFDAPLPSEIVGGFQS